MKDILNDVEKEQVEAFYKNVAMRDAVKKVLLAGIYHQGLVKAGVKPDGKNFALSLAANLGVSNEQLGQDLRGFAEGIRMLETAFKELSTYEKLIVAKDNKVNEAE